MRTILVIFIVLFTCGSALPVDMEPGEDIDIQNAKLTHVCITTIGEAEGYYKDWERAGGSVKKRGTYLLQGSGVVLRGGYVLTVAHVVHPLQVTLKKSDSYLYSTKAFRCVSKQIFLSTGPELEGLDGSIPAEIVHVDSRSDIAVLKYDHKVYDYLIPCPYRVTDTTTFDFYGRLHEKLYVSSPLFTVVYKRGEDDERLPYEFEIRKGKVIDTEVLSRLPDITRHLPSSSYTIEMDIRFGDSGSPVFAWENGVPVIVGLAHSIEATPMFGSYFDGAWAYVARMGDILMFLEGNGMKWEEDSKKEEPIEIKESEEPIEIEGSK